MPSEQGEVVNKVLGDILEQEEDVAATSDGQGLLPPVGDLDQTPVVYEEQSQEAMQQDVEVNNTLLSPPPLSPILISSQTTVLGKVSQLTDGAGRCCFSSICPPSSTIRIEAAVTFFHLLQIEKEEKLVSSQEEMFGDLTYELVSDT